MENNTLLLALLFVLLAVLAAALFVWVQAQKNPQKALSNLSSTQHPQVLQAHERMLLLVDRMALPHLLQRTDATGLGALDLQFILTKTIREEFDYNITQQLYLAPPTWKAIQSLKERNLQWIREAMASLPQGAGAKDLQTALLQVYFTASETPLHELVAAAIAHDAQMILKA